jgi:hypothetical protein
MLHQMIKFNDDITIAVAQLISLTLAYHLNLSTYRGNYLVRSRTFSKVQEVHPSQEDASHAGAGRPTQTIRYHIEYISK